MSYAREDRPKPTAREAPGNREIEEVRVRVSDDEFMDFVRIEPGSFLMGTSRELIEEWKSFNKKEKEAHPTRYEEITISLESPQHKVTITKPFYLGKYEVSKKQWYAIMDPDEKVPPFRISINKISWSEIQNYIGLLNEQTGLTFRLPTEAEWEYAARAGTTTIWWTGDDPEKAESIIRYTTQPNPWGLVQILGGVWEYTLHGKRKYEDRDEIDPVGPDPRDSSSDGSIVMRGGDNGNWGRWSRAEGDPYPWYARCAFRYRAVNYEIPSSYPSGFRLLLEDNDRARIKIRESG